MKKPHVCSYEVGYGFLKPAYFGPYTACYCGKAFPINDSQIDWSKSVAQDIRRSSSTDSD